MIADTPPADMRNLTSGLEIPSEGYCDQPYVVVLPDGTWLCVMTTGRGVEGEPGQHVIAVRTPDQGRTWEEPVDVEPADGPEASWAMPLLMPSGRVYCFYVYNTENRREVITDTGTTKRVDTLGDMMYRYSDDGGRSWSADRYRIPIRPFANDRANPYGGEVQFFWGVGKPVLSEGRAILGFAKVGRFGHGFMAQSEGAFLRCDNLDDPPEQHEWLTLPDGDVGLRAPQGPVADEHNPVALSDGSLYCTYRTIDGHPCHAYSRDGGHTWTPPEYMTYTPGGRRVKHPRAANFVKRLSGGRYLYWFHNHGGRWYDDRNPAWVLGGVERDGQLYWSQPQILLYDDDPAVRISYPDVIEHGGRIFVTETQKTIARVHAIAPELLADLWQPGHAVAREGLAAEAAPGAGSLAAPKLPDLRRRGGVSLDLWVRFDDLAPGQVVLDGRDAAGKGLAMVTTVDGTLQVVLNDGRSEASWDTDRGALSPGAWHHVACMIDGGPKIISFTIDGQLCDGGEQRPFGWGRFTPHLRDLNGAESWRLAPTLHGELGPVRVYTRALRTAEAVGNHRAGR